MPSGEGGAKSSLQLPGGKCACGGPAAGCRLPASPRRASTQAESKQNEVRAGRCRSLVPQFCLLVASWNCGLQGSSARIYVRCRVPDPRCRWSCSERGSDRLLSKVSQPKFVCGRADSCYLDLISLLPTPRRGRGC